MKIGDRVKIVSSPYVAEELQPGKTGRIVALDYSLVQVVMCDEHADSDGDYNWPFDEQELEVVSV
jgi:hypothetical protein